jgi:uncharacterized membrane protein YhaH (DUF805 family)
MKWYLAVLKKYAVFQGRARRSEYWYFVLFDFIFALILAVIGVYMQSELIYNLYALAVLVPSIAVAVRRMHDVDKSGWFILIPIYNLILCCTAGTEGPNQYGSDPKRPEFDEFLDDTNSAQAI